MTDVKRIRGFEVKKMTKPCGRWKYDHYKTMKIRVPVHCEEPVEKWLTKYDDYKTVLEQSPCPVCNEASTLKDLAK